MNVMNAQYYDNYVSGHKVSFERQTQDLVAEPTKETPFVKYSRSENLFLVKGNSVRPEIHRFYDPFMSEVKMHLNEGRDLDLVVSFTMINTSTIKVFFDLFRFIRGKQAEGTKINVIWCSEDANTEMKETGEDFADVYGLNFRFLTV